MFHRKKKKGDKRRFSLFVDDFIKENSVTHCVCELYIPEPSLKFDDFGAVKEVCLSGDVENFSWSKHCMLHLCELSFVDQNFTPTIQDTGQDVEICLNITLNKQRKGELIYMVRDEVWHECRQKNGAKWRTIVLKFDEDSPNYGDFQQKLNTILQGLESPKVAEKTYLLVAVQSEKEKSESPTDKRRFTLEREPRIKGNSESSTISEDHTCHSDSDNDSPTEENKNKNNGDPFMEAPFNPAPYESAFTKTVRVLKHFSQELKRQESNKPDDKVSNLLKEISAQCDSLHIRPEELPQTLESLLCSIKTYSSELDYTKYDPKSIKDYGSVTHSKIYSGTNPKLLSEDILSETIYLPMGAGTAETMSGEKKENPKLKNAKKLGELLATAITDKDQARARDYATQLAADENVWVKVDVGLKAGEELDKEFSLKVFIEDKESSAGNIPLKVRSSDTIRDLKNRMLIKHMFPVEVQTWIIGQRIPPDTETLGQCKIKSDGHSVYLYLVSAKSVGLTKEEFMRQNFQVLDNTGGFNAAQDHPPFVQAPPPNPTPEKVVIPKQTTPKQDTKSDNLQNKLDIKITPQKLPGLKGQGQVQNKGQKGQIQGQGKKPILEDKPTGRQQTPQQIREILEQIKPNIAQQALAAGIPFGTGRVPMMHPEESEEPAIGWECTTCTLVNQPTRPGCEACGNTRPPNYIVPDDYVMTREELDRIHLEEEQDRKTREAEERHRIVQAQESQQNYIFLQQADAQDVIPNTETFDCPICFENIEEGDGVVLRECLHSFCRDCLHDHVQYSDDPVLKCPYQDDSYTCDGVVQDREIRALVSKDIYDKYLARSLTTAESQAANSFHCKTADCPGWCVYEDHVNFFLCPVCTKENCLTCKAIHQGLNCKQYQEDLKIRAQNDGAAKQTQIMIKKMVDDGDAMPCPQCQVIVMKKEGCDWIQCSICKTEICWVTKGPRWGPMGSGDISGGCQCRVNGVICHPDCQNCH